MGVIGTIFGAGNGVRQIGEAVGGVAEIFAGNRAEREAAASRQVLATIGEFGAEFAAPAATRFDGFVNGLNRLPRPMLALGTLGLFVYSMVAPAGFSTRMQGLSLVPEPLWWLLGAIVSFYFGARELHHQRTRTLTSLVTARSGAVAAAEAKPQPAPEPAARSAAPEPVARPVMAPLAASTATEAPVAMRAADPDFNAAVEEWRALHG